MLKPTERESSTCMCSVAAWVVSNSGAERVKDGGTAKCIRLSCDRASGFNFRTLWVLVLCTGNQISHDLNSEPLILDLLSFDT